MSGAPPSAKIVHSHSRSHASDRMRCQLWSTIGGAVLLLLCLAVISGCWVYSSLRINAAMEETSTNFRENHAIALSAEIAAMLKPVWVLVRQAVDEMSGGRYVDGVQVMPPTIETFTKHSRELQSFLWPKVNSETHMRNADSWPNYTHNKMIGCVAVLGCAEAGCANGTLATGLSTCADSVWLGSILNNTGMDYPTVYMIDNQYFHDNGTVYRALVGWDSDAMQLTEETIIPHLDCPLAMGTMWGNDRDVPTYHSDWTEHVFFFFFNFTTARHATRGHAGTHVFCFVSLLYHPRFQCQHGHAALEHPGRHRVLVSKFHLFCLFSLSFICLFCSVTL